MINKGKGCISAIFDGSIPIALVKHGLETVFQKPSEPVAPETDYISNGLTAYFSGEDNYVDGAWVDRISGYKFTPRNTATAPVYDETNKLYEATTYDGMLSDFTIPAGSQFSFEVVIRDVKDATSSNMSRYYATIVGGYIVSDSIQNGSMVLLRNPTSNNNYSFTSFGNGYTYRPSRDNIVDDGLDTFTFVPNVGIFHNGVKVENAGESKVERNVGLFTHYNGNSSSVFNGKGKIHSVRLYNRQLTQEEIAHNRTIDEAIYGV